MILYSVLTIAGLFIVFGLLFLLVKFIQNYKRRYLTRASLRRLPTYEFTSSDDHAFETCAVCLEDYVDGEKLRLLPCEHGYHARCIDLWLTKTDSVCPQCRKRVFHSNEDLSRVGLSRVVRSYGSLANRITSQDSQINNEETHNTSYVGSEIFPSDTTPLISTQENRAVRFNLPRPETVFGRVNLATQHYNERRNYAFTAQKHHSNQETHPVDKPATASGQGHNQIHGSYDRQKQSPTQNESFSEQTNFEQQDQSQNHGINMVNTAHTVSKEEPNVSGQHPVLKFGSFENSVESLSLKKVSSNAGSTSRYPERSKTSLETQVEVHDFMMSNNGISNDTGHDAVVITNDTKSEILNGHNPTTSQQHDQEMI